MAEQINQNNILDQFLRGHNPQTLAEENAAILREAAHKEAAELEGPAAALKALALALAERLSQGDPERDQAPVPTEVTIIDPHRRQIKETTHVVPPKYRDRKDDVGRTYVDVAGDPIREVGKKARLEVPRPGGKLRVLRRVVRERGDIGARYHHEDSGDKFLRRHEDEPDVVGRGWVISRATIRGDEHTITLLENGDLVMGTAILPSSRKERKDHVRRPVIETLTDSVSGEDISRINLSAFPVNPLFIQERGYATTNGVAPRQVEEGRIRHASEAARVAINLELIERDMRTSGRALLGRPPQTP